MSGGAVNLIPYFWDFPVFDTLNAIRAWWRKRYPFYAFLFTRMMYRPQWDIPPRGISHRRLHHFYMSWRTVLPRLWHGWTHTLILNRTMSPAFVPYTKDRSYKNLKQPRQSSETRTAQRAKSGVRDSTRWTARVRTLISILIFLFISEVEVYSVNKLKSFKTSKLK